jgi:glucose-6-phosphate isomerase
MPDLPFSFEIVHADAIRPSKYDNHVVRRLSAMRGQFTDQQAYETMLEREDTILYEVYELSRPEVAGELLHGISIVHPGTVGAEYFMTKGHFHATLESAEVYYCLKGEGYMLMETPEGEWAAEPLHPQTVLYVPPRWAHRSVNVSRTEDLVTFFVYPGHAGHDYGSIEKQGFRKILLDGGQEAKVVDNPRWLPPEERR